MQLFRNELQIGFEKKGYFISVESLDVPNIKFSGPHINCVLSCKPDNQGFNLKGNLSCNLLMHCDRCLTEFQNHQDILFKLILTPQKELLSEKNEEIIFFTEELEQIDISPFIRETMQLSTPIKIICGESCMGLCSHCGVNLNIKSCNCKSRKKRLPFEKLDQLISN